MSLYKTFSFKRTLLTGAKLFTQGSIRGMFALRIKAQRPERTAKYMEKFHPERGIGINRFPLSRLVEETSNGHTGG